MPDHNNFQHSTYSRADPGERVGHLAVEAGAPPDSLAWQDAMARYGTSLAQAGVRAVLFMHGTFWGTDLFGTQRLDEVGGLKRGYSRGISGLDALLSLMREEGNGMAGTPGGPRPPLKNDDQTRKWIDDSAKDAANFSASYVNQFEKAVNRDVDLPIACTRYLWSSEHHHLGRAKAACLFIDRLRTLAADLTLGTGNRVLVLAHGHAGQVLALVSNLLAPGNSSGRKTFLDLLSSYLEASKEVPEVLESIGNIEPLLSAGTVLNRTVLDVVTFGTPVRYGWDPSSLGKLLHIVNHRMMRADGKRWLTKMEMPQVTMEMPIAWGGDYVQQLAVAGCDAVPTDQAARDANKALWEILEPWDGFERWLEIARKCVRCPNDGRCLLVDYKDSTGSVNALDHLYGHAAYTRLTNLLFNTTEIVRTLYPTSSVSPGEKHLP